MNEFDRSVSVARRGDVPLGGDAGEERDDREQDEERQQARQEPAHPGRRQRPGEPSRSALELAGHHRHAEEERRGERQEDRTTPRSGPRHRSVPRTRRWSSGRSRPAGASRFPRHSTGGRTASMRAAVRTVATMKSATNPPNASSSNRLSRSVSRAQVRLMPPAPRGRSPVAAFGRRPGGRGRPPRASLPARRRRRHGRG